MPQHFPRLFSLLISNVQRLIAFDSCCKRRLRHLLCTFSMLFSPPLDGNFAQSRCQTRYLDETDAAGGVKPVSTPVPLHFPQLLKRLRVTFVTTSLVEIKKKKKKLLWGGGLCYMGLFLQRDLLQLCRVNLLGGC